MEALKNARLAPAPPYLLEPFAEVVSAHEAFTSNTALGCVLFGLPGYEIIGPYDKGEVVPAVVVRSVRGNLSWVSTPLNLYNGLFPVFPEPERVSKTPVSVVVVPSNTVNFRPNISPTK